MKNFIVRIAIFCAIIICILTVLFITQLDKVKLSANKYEYKRQQGLYLKTNEINALALGNSRSIGIDFKTLQLNGFHYWRAGGDLDETRIILKEVCRDLPELQEVFIPIYFTALIDNEYIEGLRRLFYSLRPLSAPISGDVKNWINSKFYFFGSDYAKTKLEVDGLSKLLINEYGVGLWESKANYISPDSLMKLSKSNAERHVNLIESAQKNESTMKNEFKKKVLSIIHTTQTNNIRLIFYSPPFHHEYDRIMKEKMAIDPRVILTNLCVSNNIEYYDFSQEDSLNSNLGLFRDSHHLNLDSGAIVLYEKLKEKMLIFEHGKAI